MTVKKALMLVGGYAEDYETMVPFQALQMMDHQVHAVYPDKQAGQSVRTAIHDFEGDQAYSEKPGHNFALNADFTQARVEDYSVLLIPGDYAPEYLRLNEQMLALMRTFDAARKPIAVICYGAQLLVVAGIPQRRACSAYPTCTPEVRLAGGECINVPSDQAHVDGHLVTVPVWPAHPVWSARFLEVFGTHTSH